MEGNVRELENVMERAVILSRGETIQLFHLPEEFQVLMAPANVPCRWKTLNSSTSSRFAHCQGF